MAEPLIGVQIRPTEDPNTVSNAITFDFVIGHRNPNYLFISSPSIRHAIKEHHVGMGAKLGYIDMMVLHPSRTIDSRMVYPFISVPSLSGKGIGTLIELQIERWLAKKYPGYLITSTSKVSRVREAQLRKRGRTPGKKIEIERAAEMTRQKAVEQFRKHFGKEIIPIARGRKKPLKRLSARR